MEYKKNNAPFVWDYLKNTQRAKVIYGTGNGAQKLIDNCRKYGINVDGIFASDDFVRGQSFCGYKVKKLSELENELGDFTVLLGFAAYKDDLLNKIYSIAEHHELLAPEVPVFGDDIFTPEVYEENLNDIKRLYSLLEDGQSRRVLSGLIDYKLSGNIGALRDIESDRASVFTEILKPDKDEFYVDVGAFDGDTIKEFLKFTDNKYRRITAFEPAPKNYQRLCDYIHSNELENVSLFNAAAYNCDGIMYIDEKGGRNQFLKQNGKIAVPTVRLDGTVDGATYIKYDVEGAEFEALTGSRETIKKYTPKLSFGVYHRTLDFIKLPLYLNSICPDYKLYLRHHPYIPGWETNLYAVPKHQVP